MEKGMNRNQLKYIAVIAMIIDHVGMFFVSPSNPIYIICRVIGRLTAPIMCYFLAEGLIILLLSLNMESDYLYFL